jgi:hypothetical protein
MKIGLGYNRLTGDRLPTPAVQGSSITSLQGAAGQQVTLHCTTITDVETLHKSLGISVDAAGSYMGFSGSAKVDYANSCDFSSFSTYVVVRVTVQDATETVDSPIFSSDANELLVNNNPDRFRQRFGDTFIAGVLKGGEFFAIYQITGSDRSEKESVANDVHAAFDGGMTSAELNTSIKTATQETTSHLEIHVHVFRQGTISTADLNLEDIMKTAKEFPIGVSGDKAFPYAVLLQDYDGLKNPNDQFVYVDIQNRQDVLEDLAKKRFEFLALRDDLKYVLKHSDDFQNADGTPVVRDKLSQDFNDVVDAINTMQREASVCTRDARQCEFTKFEVAKFSVPMLAKGPEDVLVVKGEAIVNQDPLAVALRRSLPDAPSRRGFNIAFAVDGGGTAPGPGKDRIRDSLIEAERGGFNIAVSYFVERNRNLDLATRGAEIAKHDPIVAAARIHEPDAFYSLGFDIATGLFGDPALGGQGDTAMGPGKQRILDSLSKNGKRGFEASMKLHLGPPPLPRRS